ncbi:hypothetical protein DFH06DRAFT_1220222 [Mycena polygramma]|nr:hypothetical protein DFH06DRAFT_1220222 [Mycena polygramma]
MARRALLKAMKSKPPVFFRAVRHIILDSSTILPLVDAKDLLKLCTRLRSFGASYLFTAPFFLPILAELGVQRLAIMPQELFGAEPIDLRHQLFRYVTHLDLFGVKGVADVLKDVPTLGALTHLSLARQLPHDRVMAVFETCPCLRLLLIQWSLAFLEEYNAYNIPRIYDVRFVLKLRGDYWTEWTAGLKGVADSDFWSEADDFVARKRKGEIEATRYWMN